MKNALLSKLSGHIPKFVDANVFPYGGSDFTFSKDGSGKVTLLETYDMEIIVACQAVPVTLKDVKAEIYAIEHKTYSRT